MHKPSRDRAALDRLQRIAQALGVEVSDLTETGETDKPPLKDGHAGFDDLIDKLQQLNASDPVTQDLIDRLVEALRTEN